MLEAEVGVAPPPPADAEGSAEVRAGVTDEAPQARAAEEAAMHVEGPEDDVAADGEGAPIDLEEAKAEEEETQEA